MKVQEGDYVDVSGMNIERTAHGHQHVSETLDPVVYKVGKMPELNYNDEPCKWAEMEHEHFAAIEVTP